MSSHYHVFIFHYLHFSPQSSIFANMSSHFSIKSSHLITTSYNFMTKQAFSLHDHQVFTYSPTVSALLHQNLQISRLYFHISWSSLYNLRTILHVSLPSLIFRLYHQVFTFLKKFFRFLNEVFIFPKVFTLSTTSPCSPIKSVFIWKFCFFPQSFSYSS